MKPKRRNNYRFWDWIFILFGLFILSLVPSRVLSDEGGWIATSDIPGELWIIVQLPSEEPPYPVPQTKPRLFHSTDYGRTFDQVNDLKVSNLQFHRATHTQTYWWHDVSRTLLFTHDNSNTFHEMIDHNDINFHLTTHTWARGGDQLVGFRYSEGFSYDTLRTYSDPELAGSGFDPGPSYSEYLGWSTGDICLFMQMYAPGEDTLSWGYTFSDNYGDSLYYRSSKLSNYSGSHMILCGEQPGEVYHLNEYQDFIDVSMDTMCTWQRFVPSFTPPQAYVFSELERGWEPGELYYYYYADHYVTEPTGFLWHSTDFGESWELMYDARFPSRVLEDSGSLPVASQITVYPNPGNGQFRVNLPVDALEIKVVDLLGRIVLEKPVFTNDTACFDLELASQPSGTYFMIVHGRSRSYSTFKVILVR